MSARIVVVGSMNMDLITRTPRIPLPGETIIGHEYLTAPGGKGANQAVAAARMGAQVDMVGRVGQDAFGEELLANLTASDVQHATVVRDGQAATGVALILVDDAGENSIVVASGANARVSADDVDAAGAAIAEADALLLQLEIPIETVTHAAALARAHGVKVILNPAPARPTPPHLLTLVDILIPNEHETALLASMQVNSDADAEAAAAKLLQSGPQAVILTLGGRGALLATAEGMTRIPAFPVTPVDTTAAGDSFVAGFSVALAEGKSLQEAVRWGSAAGALATTKLGAQPSIPYREEVMKLME
ncbi:MAG: ribokinase [Caldilineales bacterium]|nr:ribokinase [Caldilineales bacterium]